MNKYQKYSESNPTDTKQIVTSLTSSKIEVNEINEQSTPKEMANFIAKKLAEFIEKELKSKVKTTEHFNGIL